MCIYRKRRENTDHGRITWLPRTIVGWKGEVIYSNASVLCPCPPTTAWSAHQQWGVLQNVGQGECVRVCVCQTTREKERERESERERERREKRVCQWQGSQIKGRKAPFPQLNVPQGGVREGEREQEKRERLWTDNTPARLQIYNCRALRALPCLFLQPVKTNCSHVSITHILFLLIRSGRAAFGCCIISLSITPE